MEHFNQKRTKCNSLKIDDNFFSDIVGYEQFLESDKRKLIVNFFLSNEIVNLVHDNLFLSKNITAGLQRNDSDFSSRETSVRNKSVASFSKTGMGFTQEKKMGITTNSLFHKTTFPFQQNKLVTNFKYPKKPPSGISLNIAGKINTKINSFN